MDDTLLSQDEETQEDYIRENHPWLEIASDSLDDEILYSLDEIRYA